MRRAATLAVIVVLVAAAAGVGWWVGSTNTKVPEVTEPEPLTVPVRQSTVTEFMYASGSIQYRPLVTLRADRGVVTGSREIGTIIGEGESPIEISLRPMTLVVGKRPMFRDLDLRSEGADVLQFQAALNRLGYDIGEPDGVFGRSTRTAWRAFQEDLGLTPIDAVSSTDIGFVPELPARIGRIEVAEGERVGGPLVAMTAPTPEIVATLPPGDDHGVATGTPAELIWTGSEPVEATVARVETLPEGDVAVLATESPVTPPESFRVRFVTTQSTDEGLVVPLSALATDADGTNHVTVWDPTTSTRRSVDVVILASSRTEAQVDGELELGDEVVVGQ